MSRVAEAVLEDPAVSGMGPSRHWPTGGRLGTTVTRFAVMMGYSGYPALRGAIALDNGRSVQSGWEHDIGTEIRPDHAPDEVLGILAGTQARALRDSASVLDVDAIERAAAAVAEAGRVHLFAEWGTSRDASCT